MPKVIFRDLGLIDYKKAWDYQERIFSKIVETKSANRKNNTNNPTDNYLLFCEHPHVYTLGKSGNEKVRRLLFTKLIEEVILPIMVLDKL